MNWRFHFSTHLNHAFNIPGKIRSGLKHCCVNKQRYHCQCTKFILREFSAQFYLNAVSNVSAMQKHKLTEHCDCAAHRQLYNQ